jgi:ubiquinone/menaquinone biosynthesis C-methylase UbiE
MARGRVPGPVTSVEDPFAAVKAQQREGWKNYAALEVHTIRAAARLVDLAGVREGQSVLDVACGTGSVAITAALRGAKVTGLDLTPELLAHGKELAAHAGADPITWREGDVENLPFKDAAFDVVLSQFGHLFAPRPDVAIGEMLRVLKPGGTIAFSTWPPHGAASAIFAVVAKHLPPPPPGMASPVSWGDTATVRARLGNRVRDLRFEHAVLEHTSLSPRTVRMDLERSIPPVVAMVQLHRGDPARLQAIRDELERGLALYHRHNAARLEYLVTRAVRA